MSAKTKVAPAEFTGTRPDTSNLPSLRDLDEADGILREFLAETEGEETPEIAGLSEWLANATEEKIERWGLWLRNRKAEIGWLKGQAAPFAEEADRIMARAKELEAAVERSERRLLYEMQLRGKTKVEGKLLTVARQLSTPHVVGDEHVTADDLMELYMDGATADLVRFKPETYALDKDGVKRAIKAGILPAKLVEKGVGMVQDERVVIK